MTVSAAVYECSTCRRFMSHRLEHFLIHAMQCYLPVVLPWPVRLVHWLIQQRQRLRLRWDELRHR